MSIPIAPVSLPGDVSSETLLHSVLGVSLTGIQLLRPVYAADGFSLVDFAFVYTNPAGLRMIGLAEPPSGTLVTSFPHTLAAGVLAYYQRAFAADEGLTYEANYQADGVDNYFRFQARRSGQHLLVSFTDTSDQPRSAVEQALRASQAREQRALAEAEVQRTELQQVFEQAPIALARLHGPEFVVEWANGRMGQIWGRPLNQLVGRPHFEALPDLAGQGFEAVLAGVLHTGESQYFRELLVHLEQAAQPYQGYFNITYQPTYDELGHRTGILASAIEVTDQVRARQQVQTLNEEFAALNEELHASNEEYLTTNTALAETQLQLRHLNQELEARVQERTAQLRYQQGLLTQIMRQVPAAIATLSGAEHRYTFFNEASQATSGGRLRLGRSVAELFPESLAQGLVGLLDQVYATGQPLSGTDTPIHLANATTGQPELHYQDFIYQPLFDAQGQPQGILTFLVDVTDKVVARQQAQALQAELLATAQDQAAERLAFYHIFEQAPVLVALLRAPTHCFEYVNPAYQALFPGRQLVGRDMEEAVPEMQAQGFTALMDRVYQTGDPYVGQGMPFAAQPAPGQPPCPAYYNFTYQAYREQGQVVGISIFAHDVTEQMHTRQQVERLNQQLAAINEELTVTNEELSVSNTQLTRTNVDLDTFVYTASHDLKAPITNIESIVLALRDTLRPAGQPDALVPHLLDLLDQTVARFQFTIGQLTDISRLQLAHAGLAESVHLAITIEQVRLDLLPAIAAGGTHLTVTVAPELVVSFSPANLRSIVYNLLSNAVKYRAPDRPAQVVVRAIRTGPDVVVEVQDNGLGLNAHQQQRLFGLFQRLHTHVEGTGVGLYITKRLVENGGGTIAVESQVDVGTTFTLTFPA